MKIHDSYRLNNRIKVTQDLSSLDLLSRGSKQVILVSAGDEGVIIDEAKEFPDGTTLSPYVQLDSGDCWYLREQWLDIIE